MAPPDDPTEESLKRLDERIKALESARTRTPLKIEQEGSGMVYRLIAELVGGVLMGLGFGWAFDHFAHTRPLGMICGLLLGAAGSIFVAVRSLSATVKR